MHPSYFEHLQQVQQQSAAALEACGFDGLLIGSGHLHPRFLDDNYYPFRANPHFLRWLPFLSEHPHCWLLWRPGRTPVLYYHAPDDFWHLTPSVPDDWWTTAFEIRPYSAPAELHRALQPQAGLAVISEQPPAVNGVDWPHNPQALLNRLHFQRAVKTDWELHCLRQANVTAVKGHTAAEQLFHEGASEYRIHQGYLQAIEHNERDMPYDNIVALNEHAAVLHYQFQQRQAPQQSRTLLLDAGAVHLGYAADITRTFTAGGTPFAELVAALDRAQRQLLGEVKAGACFIELHRRMHHLLAGILQEHGLVNASAESIVERGISRTFFPHGLGHLLGLQVHDVGGWQQDGEGALGEPPAEHPFLRLTRELQPGFVITIEPGLYFIPSLLKKLRDSEAGADVNWQAIGQLQPWGGIRIEDNVAVTDDGCENFTRDAFAAQQAADQARAL
ncbi:Xaa-Pro dipeptidase [Marinobacterium arenosum]|uniref:Xaa-Pro dipeptidase n=1 Tax=Marinobacterium arenosum TaxID=2862496 RepID=UPI001C95983D|nr:Xaa-Pro dipeptidase [Marinobacterium arenosum]MBY4678617.1 Xaa-Pro dipeptidase [Marinobacterium arenosum]